MWEKWKNQINFINTVAMELGAEVSRNRYCHYTSLSVLFSILDNDECWISNARFSNDSSEELLLGDIRDIRDDYIMCFCDSGDQLSQWRGYCHNGGASIEFYLDQPVDYSVLWANYNAPTNYELCENRPLPVIYFPSKPTNMDIQDFQLFVDGWKGDNGNTINYLDIVPYVKNNEFSEERELRMVFSNMEGRLDKCIRFRTLDNGVKVPYMVIKYGDIGKMMGKCSTTVDEINDEYLEKKLKDNRPIWIDEGSNQKEIYLEIKKKVNTFLKGRNDVIKIFCRGHWPILQIKVAPSDNPKRVVEQIKRFCRSKYWLSDVEISQSEIPYVRSLT